MIRFRFLSIVGLGLLLAGCAHRGVADLDATGGQKITRSVCPAVAVPVYTGDVSLFAIPQSRDARALDVTAEITNLQQSCDSSGAVVHAGVTFDVVARRASPSGARDVVLMPSFVNIGASVGEGTMVDTWATVGSCAQIGANVHLSGGAGIGGVLEPLQANPTIIEDGCFVGARSEVAEGVIVEEGAVLSMGVFLGASTKIVDRATGAVHRGRVPAYSVVVPGVLPDPMGGVGLACAVIVKRVDAQTRAKTAVNELLRE